MDTRGHASAQGTPGSFSGGARGGARGRTVLVVDDEASIRGFVRQALEAEGHVVREAADGAAALALLERESTDLVLLDLWMPVMDGWQFAEAYAQLDEAALPGGRAPLVVFTAERTAQAAEHARLLKAAGHLAKPFDIQELLDVVGRYAREARESGAAGMGDGAADAQPVGAEASGLASATAAGVGTVAEAQAQAAVGKLTREEIQRQQQVERLRRNLGRLQEDMGRVRSGVARVAEIETSRRLTREEARWASQLRMESERLRYELQLIREEFFCVRGERGERGPQRVG